MAKNNKKSRSTNWSEVVMESPMKIQVNAGESSTENGGGSVSAFHGIGKCSTTKKPGSLKGGALSKGKNRTGVEKKAATAPSNARKKQKSQSRSGMGSSQVQNTATNSLFIVTEKAQQLRRESKQYKEKQRRMYGDDESSDEEQQFGNDTIPNYIKIFMKFMYWLGLSTFDPDHDPKKPMTWGKFLLDILIKLVFWIGFILGILYSIRGTKAEWLSFVDVQGITNFVDFGFQIVGILAQISIAHLFSMMHAQIRTMFCCLVGLNALGKKDKSSRKEIGNKEKKKKQRQMYILIYILLVTMAVVSVLVCCLKTGIIGGNVKVWTLEKLLLYNSKLNSYGLYIWKVDDIRTTNFTDTLVKEYGTNSTILNIFMGSVGVLMKFSNNMRLEFAIDIIILAGWCLNYFVSKHANKVSKIDFTTYTNGDDCAELNSPTGDWATYKILKKSNKAMNAVFGAVLKVMHAYNIMLSAYFLMHILDNNVTSIHFLLLVYNIMKISIAYRIAKKSHGYNAVFQQWMRDWAIHSDDKKFILKVSIILNEMKAEPIGLGTGEFIIDETFILKFVGIVSSLFTLQVDKNY